jgi:hypothetical protein
MFTFFYSMTFKKKKNNFCLRSNLDLHGNNFFQLKSVSIFLTYFGKTNYSVFFIINMYQNKSN